MGSFKDMIANSRAVRDETRKIMSSHSSAMDAHTTLTPHRFGEPAAPRSPMLLDSNQSNVWVSRGSDKGSIKVSPLYTRQGSGHVQITVDGQPLVFEFPEDDKDVCRWAADAMLMGMGGMTYQPEDILKVLRSIEIMGGKPLSIGSVSGEDLLADVREQLHATIFEKEASST